MWDLLVAEPDPPLSEGGNADHPLVRALQLLECLVSGNTFVKVCVWFGSVLDENPLFLMPR